MCVIIFQDKGTYLEKDRAKRLWHANPDGGGFAFFDDKGDLQIKKSMFFNEFWTSFEQARSQFPKRDYLIHMRIATHGNVNLDNVHPFKIAPKQALAHNGIFNKVPDGPIDGSMSDTRMFISTVLPSLRQNWIDNLTTFEMVEDYMGWSKMAILNNNPRLKQNIYLFNETGGVWVDGMWFSSRQGIEIELPWKETAILGGGIVAHLGKLVAPFPPGTPLANRTSNKKGDKPVEENNINLYAYPSEEEHDTLAKARKERYGATRMYFSRLGNVWICTRCKGDIIVSLAVCDCEVVVHVGKKGCWKVLSDCLHNGLGRDAIKPIEELSEKQWDRVAAQLPS